MTTIPPMATPTGTTAVVLKPTPGFTVKSLVLTGNVFNVAQNAQPALSLPASTSKTTLDELSTSDGAPQVEMLRGMKVFLNICWDANMPGPPPGASEAAIRSAMMGEDIDAEGGLREGVFYVPVAVSAPRQDLDKAGKPSLVFDCVFDTGLKSRSMKDNDFRMYLIELALERVEEKAKIELSRQIGTPNIQSKGKLLPRTVFIPKALLELGAKTGNLAPPAIALSTALKPISTRSTTSAIGQSSTSSKKPKSILKTPKSEDASTVVVSQSAATARPFIEEISSAEAAEGPDSLIDQAVRAAFERKLANSPPPRWRWSLDKERIKIEAEVPKLTRDLHSTTSLHVEPRRLLLLVPSAYGLDINLTLSDSEIGKIDAVQIRPEPEKADDNARDDAGGLMINPEHDAATIRVRGQNAGEALRLKRWMGAGEEREFDVEGTRAQWLVKEGKLVITL